MDSLNIQTLNQSQRAIKALATKMMVDLSVVKDAVFALASEAIKPFELEDFLVAQYKVAPDKAKQVAVELTILFWPVLRPQVEEAAEDVGTVSTTVTPVNPDDITTTLINSVQPAITDEVIRKRLANIITAAVKQVRSLPQTKEMLMRPVKVGGMDMKAEAAEALVGELKKYVASASDFFPSVSRETGVVRRDTKDVSRKSDALPPNSYLSAQGGSALGGLTPIPPDHQLAPLTPAVRPQGVVSPKIGTSTSPKSVSEPVAPSPQARQQLERLMADHTGYEATTSIKAQTSPSVPLAKPIASASAPATMTFAKQLVGPVEELGRMTMEEWRRLDRNPQQRGQRIVDKINLLEQQQFGLRYDGIDAWQQSQPAMLYQDISNASLLGSTPVEKILAQRQEAKQPTLSLDEYNALAWLNNQVRY